MRTLFIVFGGPSLLVAVMDGVRAALLGPFVIMARADRGLSIETLLREHLPAIVSLTGAAGRHGVEQDVLWVLALPALIYFLARIILGIMIGAAALAAAAGGTTRS